MRPAYAPNSIVVIGETLLADDPWSYDLASAITNAYQRSAPYELTAFNARLAKARGLTF